MTTADDIDNGYYATTTKTILVPVEVSYHDATGIVYGFMPPSREDVQRAVALDGKCPWDCVDGIILSKDDCSSPATVCPLCARESLELF